MGGFTLYDVLIYNPSIINFIDKKTNRKPFDWHMMKNKKRIEKIIDSFIKYSCKNTGIK